MNERATQKQQASPPSAEQTRRALIRAALKLFGTKGFDGTSTREIAGIRREYEFFKTRGFIRGWEQVSFGCERKVSQIIEGADMIGVQAVLPEHVAVVRRKRQHHIAQIAAEFFRLHVAAGRFSQLRPTIL